MPEKSLSQNDDQNSGFIPHFDFGALDPIVVRVQILHETRVGIWTRNMAKLEQLGHGDHP